jgi:hypothetical protein
MYPLCEKKGNEFKLKYITTLLLIMITLPKMLIIKSDGSIRLNIFFLELVWSVVVKWTLRTLPSTNQCWYQCWYHLSEMVLTQAKVEFKVNRTHTLSLNPTLELHWNFKMVQHIWLTFLTFWIWAVFITFTGAHELPNLFCL